MVPRTWSDSLSKLLKRSWHLVKYVHMYSIYSVFILEYVLFNYSNITNVVSFIYISVFTDLHPCSLNYFCIYCDLYFLFCFLFDDFIFNQTFNSDLYLYFFLIIFLLFPFLDFSILELSGSQLLNFHYSNFLSLPLLLF